MPDLPSEVLLSRLGYLFKHVQIRFGQTLAPVLKPLGIDGRELAVLSVLAAEYPLSQQDAAGRLGVDRTTMVTLVDALEAKGLVARRRDPEDRRRNIAELTPVGQTLLRKAEQARADVETRFLAPLGRQGADRLIRDLRILLGTDPANSADSADADADADADGPA